ncbi:potassium channel family protein [Halorientalis brevis]|uniref:Potassium channel family protein n=1 Tax=Halorientalis brevis TaxID=1126241 RepID=A0ABD6CFA6_9EURY|nr:NAD-binding protein [Halorientalis brevis]
MRRRTQRTAFYLGLVAVTTVVFTALYNVGMATWEDQTQPVYRSLEVVMQTFTTTGYGEDAPWQSLQMNVLVIVMQLAGIGLILTAVDVFAVPWLRRALTPRLPRAAPDVTDHVIICTSTARTEAFIAELDSRSQEYVLVEPDEETAHDLRDQDRNVVYGDPESTTVLDSAGIGRAKAVVADAADDTTASIVLSAREANPDVRVVTLVEDGSLAQYHSVAGADDVLSPRQLLGESLARQIPTAVTTAVEEGIEIGDDFELAELSVQRGSDLCDEEFADARIHERYGVNVIGAWFGGTFESPVDRTAELDAETTLLVAGKPERIEELREATASTVRQFSPQQVVIAGYGESGTAAYDALSETNSQLTVLDRESKSNVDVIGDAREPDVLREAGIEHASALLVALGDDTESIFATLIARDLNPDIEIVVRANEQADVEKLYRAGADYVQSLATISGRMMASTIFEDEEVLAYDKQIEVVRFAAGALAGRTLQEADVRGQTGCTVVAVEREDDVITEFDPAAFTFVEGDGVIVAGTDEHVSRFEAEFTSGAR